MRAIQIRSLLVGFAVALALLAGVAWFDWRHTARMQETAEWVAHTHEVQAIRNQLLALVLETESEQRSYVLTGLPVFLDQLEEAVTHLARLERKLEKLTHDESQKANLAALKPLMGERIAFSRRIVELRKNTGADAAAQEISTLKDKKLTDEIRAQFALMDARGKELLDKRTAAASDEARKTTLLTLTGTGLSFILLITVFTLTLRENRLRRQTQAELDRFFTLSLDMLCIASADGFFRRISPAFTQTLGWSVEEILARPFLDFVHPDDRAATVRAVETLGLGQPLLHFENRYQHKDGSWRVVSWKAVPQPDGLMYATGRDVSESKRTEEQMAGNIKALAEFKAALDEHAIVAITDARGKITYVNDKFCAISKYAREELLGKDHRIINSGHHPKEFIRELWETITSGRVWHGEIKNRAKDGSFYWVDTSIIPFLGEDGKPTQFIAIRADITGRKRTEVALRQSEERMRLAAEAAGIGVWDWDIMTGAVQWDERMFALYGLPVKPDGLASYDLWRAAVLPAEIVEQEAVLQRTVATGGRSQREFRIVRASDQVVRVILAAEMAIAGTDGQTAHVVGINLDITERKEAEEQIARLNADLEQRAAQLEEANKELESFSYSVSHDLRAPLRHVQGYVQMLTTATEGQLSDKAKRFLKTINDASVDMGMLIDDLLSFSRMGRVEMREHRVALDGMMQETLHGLEMATKERNIEWQVAPLPSVTGDASMLRQVLANLVGNAVKYTRGRDPARIEIGCAGEEDGRIIFFVRDNGAGFDMQYVHKLFGVFQRLHRADEFEGTGIGLANVRRIIARHGGRTWAEGRLDEGATFYFTLKPATAG